MQEYQAVPAVGLKAQKRKIFWASGRQFMGKSVTK